MKYQVDGSIFSEEDRNAIKSALKGNDALLFALRRFFIPKLEDSDGGDLIDIYGGIDFEGMSPEDAKIAGMTRNQIIKHMNGRVAALWKLANIEPKTKEQIEEEAKKK